MSAPRITRFVIPLAAFVLLALVLWAGIRHSGEVGQIASPLINKPAPQWELPSLNDPNQRVGSKDLRGQWYVLNIWGTWCVECRAEHETLLQAQRSGVPIIGIDWNDRDADAVGWLAQLGNPYRMVAVDHEGRAAIDWGVYGAPETFLVNPQGIVVHKHIGALTPEAWREEFVARMAPATPAHS